MPIQVSEALAAKAVQALADTMFEQISAITNTDHRAYRQKDALWTINRAIAAANKLGAVNATSLVNKDVNRLADIVIPAVTLGLDEEVADLIFSAFSDKGLDSEIVETVKTRLANAKAERAASHSQDGSIAGQATQGQPAS